MRDRPLVGRPGCERFLRGVRFEKRARTVPLAKQIGSFHAQRTPLSALRSRAAPCPFARPEARAISERSMLAALRTLLALPATEQAQQG